MLIWKSYATILVKPQENAGIDYTEIAQRLGTLEIISEATSKEELTVLNGREKLAIEDFASRLDILDPRNDDYLKKIPGYFHAKPDYDVFYIKANAHPLLTYIALSAMFLQANIPFFMADYNPYEKLGFITVAILYLLFLFYQMKDRPGKRTISILGIIPWIAALSNGDAIDLASFILVYPLFMSFANYIQSSQVTSSQVSTKDPPIHNGVLVSFFMLTAVVFVSSAIGLFARQGESVTISLAAFFFDLMLAALYCMGFERTIKKTSGKKQTGSRSLKLSKKETRRSLGRSIRILISSAIVFSAIVIYHTTSPFIIHAELAYPLSGEKTKDFSLGSLERLWAGKTDTSLPDLSDYLAHTAYQEGFIFGATYGFPGNTSIELPFFSHLTGNPGVIHKQNVLVRRFDDAWFDDVMMRIEHGSVEHMLVSQGNPARVAIGDLQTIVRSRLDLRLAMFFFMLASTAAFLAARRLTIRSNYAKRFPIRPRSKITS